eukprot:COSAG01_NODE_67054_length_268_cov_0.615385_1_plen_89_part_11
MTISAVRVRLWAQSSEGTRKTQRGKDLVSSVPTLHRKMVHLLRAGGTGSAATACGAFNFVGAGGAGSAATASGVLWRPLAGQTTEHRGP